MNRREVTKLKIVDEIAPVATVLRFTGQPIASGKGDMDLICGNCGAILVHGETATEVAMQYKVLQLVIRCQCGRHNALSGTKSIVARDKLIAEAAYYRAEKRGFAPGYAQDDWLAAEVEVDSELPYLDGGAESTRAE